MIDRKLLKAINFILLIIRNLNIFYFETTSTFFPVFHDINFILGRTPFINYNCEMNKEYYICKQS